MRVYGINRSLWNRASVPFTPAHVPVSVSSPLLYARYFFDSGAELGPVPKRRDSEGGKGGENGMGWGGVSRRVFDLVTQA